MPVVPRPPPSPFGKARMNGRDLSVVPEMSLLNSLILDSNNSKHLHAGMLDDMGLSSLRDELPFSDI